MLMMLDIPDALPLILERSGRRTELQIPMMLALLFTRRGLWRRSDGYRNRTHSNRNRCYQSVGRSVDDRDGVRVIVSHVGSGSIWRDGYSNWTYSNRNGRKHGVGRGIDDRVDVVGEINRHIGSGSVRRDGYPKRILICAKRHGRKHGVGRGIDERNGALPGTGHVGAVSIWRNSYPRSSANRNGRNHSVGRGVDDRDDEVLLIGYVGSGSVWSDGDFKRT